MLNVIAGHGIDFKNAIAQLVSSYKTTKELQNYINMHVPIYVLNMMLLYVVQYKTLVQLAE